MLKQTVGACSLRLALYVSFLSGRTPDHEIGLVLVRASATE